MAHANTMGEEVMCRRLPRRGAAKNDSVIPNITSASRVGLYIYKRGN